MTTTVGKGAGRTTATARSVRAAQRTPLPLKQEAEAGNDQYGRMSLSELRETAQALGVKPLPRTKGGLLEAILETERAPDKTCEGMDGGSGGTVPASECPGGDGHEAHMDLNGECPWCGAATPELEAKLAADEKRAARKSAKPPQAKVPPAATDPGDTKSDRKAQVFGDYAGQQGWAVEYQPSGESVGVVASRGSEAVHQLWIGGVWQYEGSAYTIADRVTKPRNASGAKKLLERTAESAGAELVKVANNKAFKKRAKAVKRSKISFDPATASDLEVATAIAGKRVKWHNRLSGAVETGVVGNDVRRISISSHNGDRIVKFCCQETGYRAFRLDALLEIGRGGKVAQKSATQDLAEEAQAA